MLIALYKPFGMLSQFTPDGSPNRPLSELGLPKEVYALGRLDADSEGLLLLSDEKGLNSRLLHPSAKHPRTYLAQVERVPTDEELAPLRTGVDLKTHRTLPAQVSRLPDEPALPPRDPPIRFRKNVEDCWVKITLVEGKNRQVRKMTAAIGFPTLRLVRQAIGDLTLEALMARGLAPGHFLELTEEERGQAFARTLAPRPRIPRARPFRK